MIDLFIVLFFAVLFGLAGRFVFLTIFDAIFKPNEEKHTYIDNSVHYHRHLTVINKDETSITIEDESIRTDV